MGHGANAGLPWAMVQVETVKKQIQETAVGYADIIQLSSYAAIEFCNGPKIGESFRFGREDA